MARSARADFASPVIGAESSAVSASLTFLSIMASHSASAPVPVMPE